MTEEKERKKKEKENTSSAEGEDAVSEVAPEEKSLEESQEPEKTETADPKEEIKQLRLELDEYKNLYLRKAAEFENFRKRKQQEFQALIHSAEEALITSLLPVLDDLDRVNADNGDKDSLLQGVQLIKEKLWDVLSARGLEPIESVGKPFDPELHEAIMQQEEKGADADIVLQEHERGYRLGSKVIRHAKVVVSSGTE